VKVLVTRPRDRAGALCAQLEAAGLEPVCLPVIETQPLEDLAPLDAALTRLARYDWLVFASAEAARLFGARAAALGIPIADRAARGRPRIVAGPSTAHVLASHGLPAQVVSPFSAERVLETVAPLMRTGQHALLPRGEQGLPTLADGLRARGLVVDEILVYRTVTADAADTGSAAALDLLARRDLAAVTFFSPSAVAGLDTTLAAALPAETTAQVKAQAVAACIGPTTAAAARDAGWSTIVTAPDTTAASLGAVLVARLSVPAVAASTVTATQVAAP